MNEDSHALIHSQREDAKTIQELRDRIEGLEQDLDFWKRKALRHAKTIQRMEEGEL